MFKKTANPYRFKYLITGITGEGIQEVYLPMQPPQEQIHFKKEDKFVRPEPSPILKKAISDYAKRIRKEPSYIHPMQHAINAWAEQEHERCDNGFWFWNAGVATYLTPFHYWYLTAWITYFGHPDYREPDKEICYFLLYCEEDPESFGMLLNTIRRYGKSALMGGWAMYRTSRNFAHFTGMQGETDDKIATFYTTHIKNPFRKMPFYFTPTYDTSSTLAQDIKFERQPVRGRKAFEDSADEEDVEVLESYIEYRQSGEGAYDQAVLHTYLGEEVGKTLKANVSIRWDTVKPCLRRGKFIRGKALLATTVEFMDTAGRGGKVYKALFYESDVDDRQEDGRTVSGLYACFLPGDCAYEGFFDEHGHPMREEARRSILIERKAVKKNPKKLSALIRKYPLTVKEIFYINSENCEFDAQVLQDRLSELDTFKTAITTKGIFEWKNKKPFTEVIFKHNDQGWATIHSLTDTTCKPNAVETKARGGTKSYSPLNGDKYVAGYDPVDHGFRVEGKSGDDEYSDSRRSRPVLFIKRKYDSAVDGILTEELLEERREAKYPYKTNRYVAMMDVRPMDPNVLFERVMLMLWYYGCPFSCEASKPGAMNYLYERGCGDFILGKYVPEAVAQNAKNIILTDGTPASTTTTSEYTDALSGYTTYFGHTIPFKDLIEDLLLFNPLKTREFDYAVAAGFTELGGKIKPKKVAVPVRDITDYFDEVDAYGNVVG